MCQHLSYEPSIDSLSNFINILLDNASCAAKYDQRDYAWFRTSRGFAAKLLADP